MSTLEEDIIEKIEELGGCKTTELIASLAWKPGFCNIPNIIEKLVQEGRILEIEYVLPSQDYRIKHFVFPVGTELVIRKSGT